MYCPARRPALRWNIPVVPGVVRGAVLMLALLGGARQAAAAPDEQTGPSAPVPAQDSARTSTAEPTPSAVSAPAAPRAGAPAGPEASAADAAPASASADRYQALLEDTTLAYQRGDWAEARRLMEIAHALRSSARTWRGMGKIAFESMQYARAVWELEQALTDPRDPLSPAMQEEAETLIRAAEEWIGVQPVSVQPKDAKISVDGTAALRRVDGRLLLSAGAHRLELQAPGYLTQILTLNTQPGEKRALQITLVPVKRDAPQHRGPSGAALRAGAWAAGGSAIALGAGALTLRLLARAEHERVAAVCDAMCQPGDPDADLTRRDRLALASTVIGVVAGAAAVTSAVLIGLVARARRPHRESRQAAVRLEGLSVHAWF